MLPYFGYWNESKSSQFWNSSHFKENQIGFRTLSRNDIKRASLIIRVYMSFNTMFLGFFIYFILWQVLYIFYAKKSIRFNILCLFIHLCSTYSLYITDSHYTKTFLYVLANDIDLRLFSSVYACIRCFRCILRPEETNQL